MEESRDELQAAAAALQAGRELLMPSGQDPNDNTINRKNSPSLATELLLTKSKNDEVHIYFQIFSRLLCFVNVRSIFRSQKQPCCATERHSEINYAIFVVYRPTELLESLAMPIIVIILLLLLK